MKNENQVSINISTKSIVTLILLPLLILFLWTIRETIFSLLIGFILMSAMRPAVGLLVTKGFPNKVAIFTVYTLFVLTFILLISLIIPPIIIETSNLIKSLPVILEDTIPQLAPYINVRDLSQYLPNVTNNIFSLITGIFSNTLFVITTMFFGLYFLLEEKFLSDFLVNLFDKEKAQKVLAVLKKSESRMSSWFWGEITLMTVVGTMTFIGLNLVGIKYALPLAVLAGLLEVVPNIGPTISAIPAVIIGMSSSYFVGFSTLALYVVVQQLENNLIVPMIMKRAVGLNPVMTLVSLLVGGKIGGFIGVLLAIPIYLFAETIIAELSYFKSQKPNI